MPDHTHAPAKEDRAEEFITLSSYPRAILHVDCDAFFASCEQARDARLKGLPVITGKERGIVSCPSYEAKALGVKRGMTLKEARAICPEAVVLPSDYETYSIYSERVFSILRRFTPDVEEFSIDEAFCDITGLRRLYRSSYPAIAQKVKACVEEELGITVSVGLSLSKTLAKICSKHKKPSGLVAVPGYRLHEFLRTTALERVCGFGPNTVALLMKCGVATVLDYVRRGRAFAEKLLGKIGIELWHELRGESVYAISAAKKETYLTISKTKTFSPPSDNKDFVKAQLLRNLESACIKLRRHRLAARTLMAYLKKADFNFRGMEARITRHSSSTLDFTGVCAELFEELYCSGVMYRATGIIISDIAEEGTDAADLFDDPIRVEKFRAISVAVDDINALYGKHTLHVAASDAGMKKEAHPRNDLHWRKKELLKGETFRRRLALPLLRVK